MDIVALFNSRNLEVSKQTLNPTNCQQNIIQAKQRAYTLEEVVQLANTRGHTHVNGPITKVHNETTK